MAITILPPFPDELIEGRDKEKTIRFLQDSKLPSRIAARHLTRWAKAADVELTPTDIRAVRRDLPPPETS